MQKIAVMVMAGHIILLGPYETPPRGGDFGGWVETQQFISTHWARANPQVWSTVLSRNISIFIMRLRDRSTKYIHAKRVKLVEDL